MVVATVLVVQSDQLLRKVTPDKATLCGDAHCVFISIRIYYMLLAANCPREPA
jgi:hypothetical protein